MEFFRQIEEDLRNIGAEAKKKHPEVKDASDRAIVALKSVREVYVADIIKQGNSAANHDESGGGAKQNSNSSNIESVTVPQSSDVLAPYILTCNYADVSPKLLNMALTGIQLLLNYGVVLPNDVKNILRVMSIQANSSKFEMQLKLLQILLQMADLLTHQNNPSQYFTESTINSFLLLAFQICDSKNNVSVSTAALSTARQIISMVMDGAQSVVHFKSEKSDKGKAPQDQKELISISIEQASSSYVLAALMLVRDVSLFMQLSNGEWLRGITIPQPFALDLMFELLHGWQFLFHRISSFRNLIKSSIIPGLKPLLRNLQDEYIGTSIRFGVTSAASLSFRVVRIVRIIMLEFLTSELFAEAELLLIYLVHAMQPDRAGDSANQTQSISGLNGVSFTNDIFNLKANLDSNQEQQSIRSRIDEAGAALISRLSMIPGANAVVTGNNISKSLNTNTNQNANLNQSSYLISQNGMNTGSLSTVSGFYVHLSNSTSNNPTPSANASGLVLLGNTIFNALTPTNPQCQIPAHTTACCLEALLSMLLSHNVSNLLVKSLDGLRFLEILVVNTVCAVSTILQAVLGMDTNIREFEQGLKNSPLHALLKGLLLGASPSATNHNPNETLSPNAKSAATTSTTATGLKEFEDISLPSDAQILKQTVSSKTINTFKRTAQSTLSHSESSIKAIHEYIMSSNGAKSGDVLVLAYNMLQLCSRLILKTALQLSLSKSSFSAELLLDNALSTGSTFIRALKPTVSRSNSAVLYSNASSSQSSTEGIIFMSSSLAYCIETFDQLIDKNDSEADTEVDKIQFNQIRSSIIRICENSYEFVLDACSMLLHNLEIATVIRSSLGVISEVAISAGLLLIHKPCEVIMSVLSRWTVPLWHGHELMAPNNLMVGADSDAYNNINSNNVGHVSLAMESVKWKHVQAIVRLLQVVHLIGDVISDWDSIVDALDQLINYFCQGSSTTTTSTASVQVPPQKNTGGNSNATNSNSLTISNNNLAGVGVNKTISSMEMEKIFRAVERFKKYTVYLSDNTLMKLMTSLVALSMNSLAVNATRGSTGSSNMSGTGNQDGEMNSMPSSGGINLRLNYLDLSKTPSYLVEGVKEGWISFSLQSVIEIAKYNAFRISTVWQMVISHFRMIASQKSASSRATSVAATRDVIETTLRYIQKPIDPQELADLPFVFDNEITSKDTRPGIGTETLSDEILFNYILPTFESVFIGRSLHKNLLEVRARNLSSQLQDVPSDKYSDKVWEGEGSLSTKSITPPLSQRDLLSSLKSLSSVRYNDVRIDIIAGLMDLLQGKGHILTSDSGWPVIIELISSVPQSMCSEAFLAEFYNPDNESYAKDAMNVKLTIPETLGSVFLSNVSTISKSSIPQYEWPKEALSSSFNCMKLIVDEFLHAILPNSELVKTLIEGLALFSSQNKDVNISLTSLEMLWKVSDLALSTIRKSFSIPKPNESKDIQDDNLQRVESIFGITLRRLYLLSTDSRPEIRHCAMNTLFSALAAHSVIMTSFHWRMVFISIIFPLFDKAADRSKAARRSHEEAIAPELKKGVKMSVHHSRDTAHKQWTETRVLALRGMIRVIKICTRSLLQEEWFEDIWNECIKICQSSLQTAKEEQEVSVTGLEIIFAMLKVIMQLNDNESVTIESKTVQSVQPSSRSQINRIPNDPRGTNMKSTVVNETNLELAKQKYWKMTWLAISDSAFFSSPSFELAYAVNQQLIELYRSRIDQEFRYCENIRILLDIIVTLSRPRLSLRTVNHKGTSITNSTEDSNPSHHTEDDTAAELSSEVNPSHRVEYYNSHDAPKNIHNGWNQDKLSESQLHKSILELLKEIRPSDTISYSFLISTLAEITFSFQSIVVSTPLHNPTSHGEVVALGPCSEKFRIETGQYLIQLISSLQESTGGTDPPSSSQNSSTGALGNKFRSFSPIVLDTVVKRFVIDLCEDLIIQRSSRFSSFDDKRFPISNQTSNKIETPSKPPAKDTNFFQSWSNLMSNKSSQSILSSPSTDPNPVLSESSSYSTVMEYYLKDKKLGLSSGGGGRSQLHRYDKVKHSSPTDNTYTLPAPDRQTLPLNYASTEIKPHSHHREHTLRRRSRSDTRHSIIMNLVKSNRGTWQSFYLLDIEMRILIEAVRCCLSNPKFKSNSLKGSSQIVYHFNDIGLTDITWGNLMICLQCLLSPWSAEELHPSHPQSDLSSIHTPPPDDETVNKTKESMKQAVNKLFEAIVNLVFTVRMPANWILLFLDTLINGAMLGILSVDSPSPMSQKTEDVDDSLHNPVHSQLDATHGSKKKSKTSPPSHGASTITTTTTTTAITTNKLREDASIEDQIHQIVKPPHSRQQSEGQPMKIEPSHYDFYQILWMKTKDLLVKLIATTENELSTGSEKEKECHKKIKRRAVHGLIGMTKGLCTIVYRRMATSDPIPREIFIACADFLQVVIDLSISIDEVVEDETQTETVCPIRHIEQVTDMETLHQWMLTCLDAAGLSGHNLSPHRVAVYEHIEVALVADSKASEEDLTFTKKFHLLSIVSDAAKILMVCPQQHRFHRIRDNALKLITTAPLHETNSLLNDHLQTIQTQEQRVNHLEKELWAIKSAATLPF